MAFLVNRYEGFFLSDRAFLLWMYTRLLVNKWDKVLCSGMNIKELCVCNKYCSFNHLFGVHQDFNIARHNLIRDVIASFFLKLGFAVKKEVMLDPKVSKLRMDLIIYHWTNPSKVLALDVGFSKMSKKEITKLKNSKLKKYHAICREKGMSFSPIIFDYTGG